MGITLHFKGTLSGTAAVEAAMRAAQQFARSRGWRAEPEDREASLWREGKSCTGRVRGITVHPDERCDPLRLWFDADLRVDDFCKTQSAGPAVHVEVVRLLMRLRPLFASLEVHDETGYWESGDATRVHQAFDASPLGWGPAAAGPGAADSAEPPAEGASNDPDVAVERVRALEALVQSEPQTDTWREDLGWALTALARQQRDLGDLAAAETTFRRTLAVRAALCRSSGSAEARRDLARTHADLAWLIATGDRLAEVEAAHRAALRLREELCRNHPENPDYASDLAGTLTDLALAARDAGRNTEAQELFARAAAVLERLADETHDGEDRIDLANDLAFTKRSEARLLRAIGREDEAEGALRRAVELHERLLAEHPVHEDRIRWHARFGANLALLGRWLEEADRFDEAEAALERAIASLGEAIGRDAAPGTRDLAVDDLIGALAGRELVLHNLGRRDDAAAMRRQAAALRRKRSR